MESLELEMKELMPSSGLSEEFSRLNFELSSSKVWHSYVDSCPILWILMTSNASNDETYRDFIAHVVGGARR